MEPATSSLEHGQAQCALDNEAEILLPMFYADMRRLARHERRRVGADDTLQTTALIHEAYLRMRGSAAFNDKSHFLRVAALAMRQVLVNYARDSVAAKRGGHAVHVQLEYADRAEVTGIRVETDETLLAVHEAVERLAQLSPRLAQVVECRFFAGYNEEETAQALDITERTVRRDWIKARAWLRVELKLG